MTGESSAIAQTPLLEPQSPSNRKTCTHYARDSVAEDIRKLIEKIAQGLADLPDKVSVEAVQGEQTVVLKLSTAPEDLGKVIGKQGRTARSMRTILGAVSMKLKKRFTLEILESQDRG